LINLPGEQINQRINHQLGRFAQFLGFNVAAISKFSGSGSEGRLTHLWMASDIPLIQPGFTEKDFPWVARILSQGHAVHIPGLEVLPLSAKTDRETYERLGARSVYNWPLNAGADVIGCLVLGSIGEPRMFPVEFQDGLQLFAQVLASALARERAPGSTRRTPAFVDRQKSRPPACASKIFRGLRRNWPPAGSCVSRNSQIIPRRRNGNAVTRRKTN
jgi:hypothetical protein